MNDATNTIVGVIWFLSLIVCFAVTMCSEEQRWEKAAAKYPECAYYDSVTGVFKWKENNDKIQH